MRGAADGLMDQALPADEVQKIVALLDAYAPRSIHYAELKTRSAGSQRFVHLNVLVPGQWQVSEAHDLLDEIEDHISEQLGGAQVTTHLEPLR
jgi:divalent metal cation (Fe/Co/Zn/Cd) transporter